MGIDTGTFENRHAVLEVDLNGLTLIVPAILVIKAPLNLTSLYLNTCFVQRVSTCCLHPENLTGQRPLHFYLKENSSSNK